MPRGCKKGERRGGRAPGTPNKKMQDIIDVLQEKGFNPVAKLIELSAIAEDAYQRHEGTNYAHNYLSIAQKKLPWSYGLPIPETKSNRTHGRRR